ncbi:MAG: oligosaccharide flippase family protein [Ginsengibacter sp.]
MYKIYKQTVSLVKSNGFRTAGIYTFSNFFAKGVSFLLLFIYSNPKFLTPDENGLLSLLSNSIFILMPFLSLGIVQSTSVDFFKMKAGDFKDFFTTSFILPISIMVLGIVGLYSFNDKLNNSYGFPLSFVLIIPFLTFLNFCNDQYFTLIRNNGEPFTYFKVAMVRIVLEISISLTLVVAFAYHWQGRVTGMLVANSIVIITGLYYFKRKGYLFGTIKKKYLTQEVSYALPIIIMQCSTFCLFASDKFFLSYFSNNHVVGIYSYACVFAAIVTLFSSALLGFVLPKIYKSLSNERINYREIRKIFLFYTGSNLIILLLVIFTTPYLYKFFINNYYSPGLEYMYLIAIGYFFWAITYFFYSFLLYKKLKRKILSLSLISIAVSLVSNYFFIKQGNPQLAAVSVCLSYFVVLCVTLFISRANISFMFSNSKN